MAFTPQAARIPSILPGLGWSRGICPTYARCFRAILDFVEDRLHRIFCRAASANKFLRVYYATVKAYLETLEHTA